MMNGPSEIIAQKENARRLRENAHSANPSGAHSRALLNDRLQKAIAHSRRWGKLLAVVRLDLDGLDAIQEHHGQVIADRVRAAVMREMKHRLNKGDTLIRLNGKGFAAVLPAMEDRENCVRAVNRLMEAAAEPVQLSESSFEISASIGIAVYPQEDDTDAEHLLRQAGQAMHRAKAAQKPLLFLRSREECRRWRKPGEPGARSSGTRDRRIRFVLPAQGEYVLRQGCGGGSADPLAASATGPVAAGQVFCRRLQTIRWPSTWANG